MTPISDANGLAQWLKEKPPEWACLIAARIALRVVPILQDALCRDEESRRARIVLPSLIALAAASSLGAAPDRFRDVRQAARATARGAENEMAETCNESQMNVIDSVEAVPEEHLYIQEMESDRDAVDVASHAVDAIVHAVQAASEMVDVNDGIASLDAVLESVVSTATEAHWAVDGANGYEEFRSDAESDREDQIEFLHISTYWMAVERDATCLDAGAKKTSTTTPIEDLSALALWPQGVLVWASRRWAEFKDALPHEERWGVWTDWYEARLVGNPGNSKLDMQKVTLAGKQWAEGPTKTNAAIENLIDSCDKASNDGEGVLPGNQDYQVALSFAGEQRDYVVEVARNLAARSIAVFYDGFETAWLWGKDGAETFHEVYSARATYVVMFISEDYATKAWTRHERRSALSRMLEEEGEYILPVRFDHTPIPGLPDTTIYLNATDYSPAELSVEIARKLRIPAFTGKASDVPPPRMTSPVGEAKFDYSSYSGRYVIGTRVAEFETKWSKAGDTTIHVYNDPASIHGVAIDRKASAIHEVKNAGNLDYTSRTRTPTTGQVVVLRNENGLYAAVQILNIKDDTRGNDSDELHFIFAIQGDGTDSFESFRDILEQ